MGAHLTQSLGVPSSADYTLTITPREAPVSATITEDGDITRFNLTGVFQKPGQDPHRAADFWG